MNMKLRTNYVLAMAATVLAISALFVAVPHDAYASDTREVTGEKVAKKPWPYFKSSTIRSLSFYLQAPLEAEEEGGVDYYEIKYGTKDSLPKPKTLTVAGNATEFRLKRLKSSQQYFFEITAYFNNGNYSQTIGTGPNTVQFVTNCIGEQKTYRCSGDKIRIEEQSFTRPNRPRFLKVRKRQAESVRLRWQKTRSTNNFVDYQVKWYKKTKKGWKLVGDETLVAQNKGLLDIEDLKSDKRYYYKVRARVSSDATDLGWTKWSDKRYFKTKAN